MATDHIICNTPAQAPIAPFFVRHSNVGQTSFEDADDQDGDNERDILEHEGSRAGRSHDEVSRIAVRSSA
ncbi:MAG: hypothetical protein ABI870_13735 [Rhodanobacter sp.]